MCHHAVPNSTHCHVFFPEVCRDAYSKRRTSSSSAMMICKDCFFGLLVPTVGADETANHPDLRMTANDGGAGGRFSHRFHKQRCAKRRRSKIETGCRILDLSNHAFPVRAHHGVHMSKPKPFCGSPSMESYLWMSALCCLALARSPGCSWMMMMMMMMIALLTMQRSRGAFELVKQWHHRVEMNMCLVHVRIWIQEATFM